jgi:Flp pilus assembly protein TadB
MSAYAAALLAAVAVLLAAGAVNSTPTKAAPRKPKPKGAALLGLLARLRRALPAVVRALGRRDARTAIARAGLSEHLTPRDVAAARAACVLLAVALTPRIAAMFPPRMLLLLLPLLFWAAAELPLLLLARRGAKRAAAMRAALPDALDLLRACLVAGLALRRSLVLVAAHCSQPVSGEFAHVATETAYGVAQSTALSRLLERNPQPEIRSLVAAIGQAERNGSPLAPVIVAQAHDARVAFNRELVEAGARAGPKIQLLVSATIVPGALIAFAAIVVAAIARGEINFA